jgi:hypothetical protein
MNFAATEGPQIMLSGFMVSARLSFRLSCPYQSSCLMALQPAEYLVSEPGAELQHLEPLAELQALQQAEWQVSV